VEIEFDPAKEARNMSGRWNSISKRRSSSSKNASENAGSWLLGIRRGRAHLLCFKEAGPGRIRVTSLRKINDREAKRYGKPKTLNQ
jgi:uncharacterized DUF497 family protein